MQESKQVMESNDNDEGGESHGRTDVKSKGVEEERVGSRTFQTAD